MRETAYPAGASKFGIRRLLAGFRSLSRADDAVPADGPDMLRYVFDPRRTLTPEEVTETMRLLRVHITSDDLRSAGFPEFMREHFRPVLIDRNEVPTK